jgi:hypothetical protein
MMDDKTRVAFYQLSKLMIAPNYIRDDFVNMLPVVELEQIQQYDLYSLPVYLHKLRRLLHTPSDDKRSIIKMLYTVVKQKLHSPGHDIIATSYPEAFEKFAAEFSEENFDIMSELLSDESASNELVAFARRVVERICNGEI